MYSIRSVLIFCALVFLLIPAFSQPENRATAEEYLVTAEEVLKATQALDQAREMYVLAAETDTTFSKANFLAADMYLRTIFKDRAVKHLVRIYNQEPEYRFDLEYWIGRSYHYGLQFDKAMDFFQRYKAKLSQKSNYQGRDKIPLDEVERRIAHCENGKKFVSNPGNYSIVNIGREINSEYDDYGPVMNEREDEIVFTTRRLEGNLNQNVYEDNKPWEDIFTSTKDKDGKWSYAKNIGPPVSTPTHNSTLALSAGGDQLFVYTDEIGNGDILLSVRQSDGTWSEPAPLPGIINSESFTENGATISKDGKMMVFVSNRPGGRGGSDLYMATKDSKGQWSKVRNLGPAVNTSFDEEGPFIDYDGVTLFFSSEGHNGMGGHDVYKTTYNPETEEWSAPLNLGYPINTPDHDLYFIASRDSKRGYYSSFREDGQGYQDIYMITIPEGLKKTQPVVAEAEKPPVKKDTATQIITKTPPEKEPFQPKNEIVPLRYVVNVIDGQSRTPLTAKVSLQGSKDNVIVRSSTPRNGVYEFFISSGAPKDYRLSVELEGYVFRNENVRIQGAGSEEKEITRTIEMRKLAVGVTSILRNIYFDFDKWTFKTESYAELNKLESMLQQNGSIKVEIGGHTDAVGSLNYNLFLSRKRAEAVKDYLVRKGVDARRIKAAGYGKSKPLASNDDEDEGRELNRRVEFKVLQR